LYPLEGGDTSAWAGGGDLLNSYAGRLWVGSETSLLDLESQFNK